ncbi:hypothetical protein ABL78_8269 [Leptomonas seymouri]|uniref:Uncharacterized protein n=1 Tax=Leptomonas seymouri TaxID=5684 RepID=A0A0N1HSX1_LEPSE|nr:hypothetical protein ABL78_8269 [Leptomonas seymouri]|eukprot:KPI82718.1 hypothetical protein ABL78_8269 [Leptomonas seymouri]
MHSQVVLRWLVRRACASGVIFSRQVGMTVHALHQLDLLNVSSVAMPSLNILAVIQTLCAEADGRSQANILHALACATTEQCSPRVTVMAELSHTLKILQEQLVETAGSLTAPETILVMEALLKLAPFASEEGSLVYRRLLDEVQERSMALASVVERPVDLLGVTRVVVEAATSAAFTAPSSSLSMQPLISTATASWASITLEHVLRIAQARLSAFSDQDLISLVDVLTVRRAPLPTAAAEPVPVNDSSSHTSASREGRSVAVSTAADASEKPLFLDAARFLLDDLLGRASLTVPNLSVAQLSAWLTRLVNLQLTDHPMLCSVVEALVAVTREKQGFTNAQLSAAIHSLGALLPTALAAEAKWVNKELYVQAYTELLSALVMRLHQRPRSDPTVLADAQRYLLPLLCGVPEVALNSYLQQAMTRDERMSLSTANLTPSNSSPQLRIFVVLSASLEKGAAVLLRYFDMLAPRDQANVATFVFHWCLYMPRIEADAGTDCDPAEDVESPPDPRVVTPKAVEMVRRCSYLAAEDAFRKHHAVCRMVDTCLKGFGAKDAVQVLNEVVVAHHTQRGKQQQRGKSTSSRAGQGTEEATAGETGLETLNTSAMQEAAARERSELVAHLSAQLQGPLQGKLKEIHTAQLVRYLSSLSKMATRARAPYNTVLLALKGRSLTSFEQVSILGVLARHHLRSPYVLYGIVRDLAQLGQTLRGSQKALLLKYLGQAGAQRLIKSPCADGLMPGAFFLDGAELSQLTLLELVFSFNGLVELRQNANPTTSQVLHELAERVSSTRSNVTTCRPPPQLYAFYSIRSSTTLAELVTSLCRYGGPSKGVTSQLLVEAMRMLQARVATSRSLFVDLTQLTWHWPYVEQYFQPSSALWCGSTPWSADLFNSSGSSGAGEGDTSRDTFSDVEWEELTKTFQNLCVTAQRQLKARLTDIAKSPQLRQNTFLWNQMACGVRFDALPPQGSPASERLWEHLDRKDLAPLLGDPQHLLDVMTVGLYRLLDDEADAELMLCFVKKHVASLRVQDGLQVWWYASQQLSSAKCASPQRGQSSQLLQALLEAAKQHVLHEDKAAVEKLSVMEQRLLQFLM